MMTYGLRADAIVGYTFNADTYCPACTHAILLADPHFATAPAAVDMSTEDLLDQLAAYELIDRDDERTFDSDDFPKVIFADQIETPESCGRCGEYLIDQD